MRLLPFDEFEIETSMSVEGVEAAIASKVEPKKRFRMFSDHVLFQGEMTGSGLVIMRITHYRNSFMPVVEGRFMQVDGGAIIVIRMRLQRAVVAFMCVWYGALGFLGSALVGGWLRGQFAGSPSLLIPFGMIVLGWGLASVMF